VEQHRTGCVVAVVRKVSGWELGSIIDEYKAYAEPKVRECDVKYISSFELSDLSNLFVKETSIQLRVRSFIRATIFTLVVLVIWLVSGSKMAPPARRKLDK
jgi:tyrosine-protein phosphatase SIW14